MNIRPYAKNRWRADCTVGGQRFRQVFETRQDAKQWLDQMRERVASIKLGIADISHKVAADAMRANEILSDKATLTSCAQFWVENHREGAARRAYDVIRDFKAHLANQNAR